MQTTIKTLQGFKYLFMLLTAIMILVGFYATACVCFLGCLDMMLEEKLFIFAEININK